MKQQNRTVTVGEEITAENMVERLIDARRREVSNKTQPFSQDEKRQRFHCD